MLVILAGIVAAPAFAQAPPPLPPGQLDQLVARIALYPDPLLGQILAAATFPNDIPPAAQWAALNTSKPSWVRSLISTTFPLAA